MKSEKGAILIIVYVVYLSFESYWLSIVAPFLLDLFVFGLMSLSVPESGRDFFTRAGISLLYTAVGATLNAFFSYAFDLSFYRGATPVITSVSMMAYAWFKVCFWERGPKWPEANLLYFVLLVVTLMCTETIVFSEPWTFVTFYIYFLSVWALWLLTALATDSPRKWTEWMPFIFFSLFWAAVIGLSLLIDLSRKHELKMYFTG
jgi:hypothetical protein